MMCRLPPLWTGAVVPYAPGAALMECSQPCPMHLTPLDDAPDTHSHPPASAASRALTARRARPCSASSGRLRRRHARPSQRVQPQAGHGTEKDEGISPNSGWYFLSCPQMSLRRSFSVTVSTSKVKSNVGAVGSSFTLCRARRYSCSRAAAADIRLEGLKTSIFSSRSIASGLAFG